ncbi:MAG: NAD(P)/FAD-dependent oxidoreductase [Bacteroidota bacterium]
MDRKAFIKKGLALGLGLPFINVLLSSCEEGIAYPVFETDFTGRVLIVGAGAAGLAAGYLLHRQGIDFEIVEAGSNYGGRMKRDTSLADFPIDLGAEWIHQSPSVLADIISDPQVNASIDFIVYNPQSIKSYNKGQLTDLNIGSNFYSEYKFKDTTWFGFFEQFIVPAIESSIRLNSPVTQIAYATDQIVATIADGTTFQADKVLVTVPVNVLKSDLISFTPTLPSAKTDAINRIAMGDGIKVFIEFTEKFYPDILQFGSLPGSSDSNGERIYYDAAFRKDTNSNILGLFSVQDQASVYTNLNSDEEIINFIINELDEIFDGKASRAYRNHVIQNWTREPYILGSYSNTFDGDTNAIMNAVLEPVANKVFFAGEALTFENQSTVHGACESAYQVVEAMLTS